MKVVGIAAEYNPFHKGHEYHIRKAREVTEADYVIVIMSGDFVQRGAPAIVDKYIRTEMALLGGADLVLELPVRYATGSAQYFALGAVSMLHGLKIVDSLCFGSECADTALLFQAAEVLTEESQDFQQTLRSLLADGYSYPAAQAKALSDCLPQIRDLPWQDGKLEKILSSPNDILGIEYCKALVQLHSPIRPVAIRRRDSSYHQETLSSRYSSATAIRKLMGRHFSRVRGQIPKVSAGVLEEGIALRGILELNDFSLLLKYQLMQHTPETLTQYLDVSPELARRIYRRMNEYTTFRDFIQLLKTREITYTRISRALLHVLLGIKEYPSREIYENPCPYARVLGFRKDSRELLGAIKKHGATPLISKLAAREKILHGKEAALIEQDIRAADLYETVLAHKSGQAFRNEPGRQIVIL